MENILNIAFNEIELFEILQNGDGVVKERLHYYIFCHESSSCTHLRDGLHFFYSPSTGLFARNSSFEQYRNGLIQVANVWFTLRDYLTSINLHDQADIEFIVSAWNNGQPMITG
jgi:hypothetical protein